MPGVPATMREFKAGTLRSGSGAKVTNPKQAIAIGLHEGTKDNEYTRHRRGSSLRTAKQVFAMQGLALKGKTKANDTYMHNPRGTN